MPRRSFVTAAIVCGTVIIASAQHASAQRIGTAPRQTIATNLLAIPFGVVSLDYEHVVGRAGLTVGLGGLHSFTYDDEDGDGPFWWNGRISWAQAKVKYYPSEQSLRGLAIGLTAGAVRASEFSYDYQPYDPQNPPQPIPQPRRVRRSESAPTLGVVVDYNFLLGRSERFLVGVGVGAKRVLKDVNENDDCCVIYDPRQVPRYPSPLQQVYPDGRFTVGFAF